MTKGKDVKFSWGEKIAACFYISPKITFIDWKVQVRGGKEHFQVTEYLSEYSSINYLGLECSDLNYIPILTLKKSDLWDTSVLTLH